jgi:hypothetical protein
MIRGAYLIARHFKTFGLKINSEKLADNPPKLKQCTTCHYQISTPQNYMTEEVSSKK